MLMRLKIEQGAIGVWEWQGGAQTPARVKSLIPLPLYASCELVRVECKICCQASDMSKKNSPNMPAPAREDRRKVLQVLLPFWFFWGPKTYFSREMKRRFGGGALSNPSTRLWERILCRIYRTSGNTPDAPFHRPRYEKSFWRTPAARALHRRKSYDRRMR